MANVNSSFSDLRIKQFSRLFVDCQYLRFYPDHPQRTKQVSCYAFERDLYLSCSCPKIYG